MSDIAFAVFRVEVHVLTEHADLDHPVEVGRQVVQGSLVDVLAHDAGAQLADDSLTDHVEEELVCLFGAVGAWKRTCHVGGRHSDPVEGDPHTGVELDALRVVVDREIDGRTGEQHSVRRVQVGEVGLDREGNRVVGPEFDDLVHIARIDVEFGEFQACRQGFLGPFQCFFDGEHTAPGGDDLETEIFVITDVAPVSERCRQLVEDGAFGFELEGQTSRGPFFLDADPIAVGQRHDTRAKSGEAADRSAGHAVCRLRGEDIELLVLSGPDCQLVIALLGSDDLTEIRWRGDDDGIETAVLRQGLQSRIAGIGL